MVETLTDLAELRRLEKKATPGQWEHLGSWPESHVVNRGIDHIGVCYMDGLLENREADATLIVVMRNSLPALLDELERLRRNNICAVCAGTGNAGELPCICGGSGQACDEAQGARELAVRLQLAQAHAVDHLRDAIARYRDGDGLPLQDMRAALAALEGRPGRTLPTIAEMSGSIPGIAEGLPLKEYMEEISEESA